MSLSCVVQTLWDLSSYNSGNNTFICHFDKNGWKVEQKHFILIRVLLARLLDQTSTNL